MGRVMNWIESAIVPAVMGVLAFFGVRFITGTDKHEDRLRMVELEVVRHSEIYKALLTEVRGLREDIRSIFKEIK